MNIVLLTLFIFSFVAVFATCCVMVMKHYLDVNCDVHAVFLYWKQVHMMGERCMSDAFYTTTVLLSFFVHL